MIVRIALLGAPVGVGKDAEAELRVFVENLALRHVVADVTGHEGLVLQHVLHDGAHLLATRGTGLGNERALTCGSETLRASSS
jgi:hypothetical protein